MKSLLSSQLCLVSLLTLSVTCQIIIDTNTTVIANTNTTITTAPDNNNNNNNNNSGSSSSNYNDTQVATTKTSNYNISANAAGYKINGQIQETQSGLQVPLTANGAESLYGNLISDLLVDIDYETTERLHVKIYDKERKQVEVPNSPLGLERPKTTNPFGKRSSIRPGNNYDFNYTSDPFSFQVLRKNGQVIFDTQDYPLVFEDQYLEISTHLPNTSNIYGLGESIHPFKRTSNITTLFTRDSSEAYNRNQYGAHPFYIDHRNGSAHGTFLLNAHGMDIITEQDRITFKVIGGVLDFYFFVPQDSRPNSVVQSYTSLVGRPMMPSQWMLGLHHCHDGYSNISQMRDILDDYQNQSIPLEALWLDLDVTDGNKSFTIDQDRFPLDDITAFSQDVHNRGHKLVARVDPSVSIQQNYSTFIRGVNASIFIKDSDGDYIGETMAGPSVFPDWFHPNITEYWDQQVITWMNLLKLDGVWSSMNEPSCTHNMTEDHSANGTLSLEFGLQQLNRTNDTLSSIQHSLLYPGYAINNGAGYLSENTVSMIAQHYGNQSHYDLHNLYGLAQSYITRNSMLKYNSSVRPLLLTRSTFAGSGQHTGHWTGDNEATWSYLQSSISSILNMQIFGIPFTGADICGYKKEKNTAIGLENDQDEIVDGEDDEELCTRWLQLGAFYPFARIHTTQIDFWNSHNSTLAETARQSMAIRYSLLPYFYTLFEEANRLGTGVWRPLIFEFPHLSELSAIDEQFMIGTDILVSPVTKKNAITVEAQFPSGSIWYDYSNFSHVINGSGIETQTLDAPLTHIPVHIRGGAVLATRSGMNSTLETPYHLIIALDDNAQAAGRLYIDDGISLHPINKSNINFIYTGNALTVNGQFAYANAQAIDNITILGQVSEELHNATLNEQVFNITKLDGNVYTITNASIPLVKGFVMNFA